VGIGTMTPDPNSDLTLASTNKGLLLNRVALTSGTDNTTAGPHTAGMFVYNTSSLGGLTPGLYFNDGSKWQRVTFEEPSDIAWLLGATIINGQNFIGTLASSPAKDLSIRAQSAEAIRIIGTKNVGIGTAVPGNTLDITTGFAGVSGVRLSNLTNASQLATDSNGDLIESTLSSFRTGSIKYSLQAGDHSGWIKLDGRLFSSLNSTQQFKYAQLVGGNPINISDASDKYLSQVTAGGLGSLSGNASNQITIAQNQLPDVTLGGTTDDPGNHTHQTANLDFNNQDFGSGAAPGYAVNGGFSGVSNIGSVLGGGAHTHAITTSSINGGVAQVVTNIKPHTMKVNVFIYLGI
jgi:hypothetical protein